MKKVILLGFYTCSLLLGCAPTGSDVTTEDEERVSTALRISYEESGKNIAQIARAQLQRNLLDAIEDGGPAHAVEFCNHRISPLMDSLSDVHNATITRVSLNNRNPANSPDGELEEKQMEYYDRLKDRKQNLKDTLYSFEDRAVYFKPIKITNQLCLNCHGGRQQIQPDTREKIAELYPDDKATGYRIGDFRGAWKVEFEK